MTISSVWGRVWNRLTEDERHSLLKLLLTGKRIKGVIKDVRSVGGLSLTEARDFVDSAWLCQQVASYDPTRMSPKEEFKAEILRIVTSMLDTVNNFDMLVGDKYEILTKCDIPKLFDLCMED